MGSATIDFDDLTAQFLVVGKKVFDWLESDGLKTIVPYDNDGTGLCAACGPYELQATDQGELRSDPNINPVGLQITTARYDRHLFCEYRSALGGVLLTWSDVDANGGTTGLYGHSILIDATPETSDLSDAALKPGKSIVLDASLESDPGTRWLTIYVNLEVNSNSNSNDIDVVSVTVFSSETTFPTSTPAPSTASPTLTPTPESEACGDVAVCCQSITLDDVTYTKVRQVTNPDEYCCSGYCTFANENEAFAYVQYVSGFYYLTSSEPCFASGALTYLERYDVSDIVAQCELTQPTLVPENIPTLAPNTNPAPTSPSPSSNSASPAPSPQPTLVEPTIMTSSPTHPAPSPRPTLAPTTVYFSPTHPAPSIAISEPTFAAEPSSTPTNTPTAATPVNFDSDGKKGSHSPTAQTTAILAAALGLVILIALTFYYWRKRSSARRDRKIELGAGEIDYKSNTLLYKRTGI